MDSQQSTTNTNCAIVQRIRDKFLTECQTNGQLYHEIDVKRVETNDWQIQRFVIEHQNEETAYQSLVRALQWKKSFGVHDRTDQDFPKEYFEFSETEIYGRDKEERLILWEKNRNHRKFSELTLLTKQFIAHLLEKADSEAKNIGMTFVSDTNGSGLSNIEMDLFKFKIEVTSYYPEIMKLNLYVDLPWMLSSISRIILALCGPKLRERVKFIGRKELQDYIDIDLIPTELDGKREPNIRAPEGVLTMKQMPELGIPDKVVEKYYKSYNKSL